MILSDAIEISTCGHGNYTVTYPDGTSESRLGTDADAIILAMTLGMNRVTEGKRFGRIGPRGDVLEDTMETYDISVEHPHHLLYRKPTATLVAVSSEPAKVNNSDPNWTGDTHPHDAA